MWVRKNIQINWNPKLSLVKKKFRPKNFGSNKYLGKKKVLSLRFWIQKTLDFGSKKCWV